jgi:subtilisin family serine protease
MTSAFPAGNGRKHHQPPKERRRLMPDAITVPAEILARHRARVLDPGSAVRSKDGTRPMSTVYRCDTMLVPAGEVRALQHDPEGNNPEGINGWLRRIGLRLRPPADEDWNNNVDRLPPKLGVPVPLVWRDDQAADRAPDPWAALTLLRDGLGERVQYFGMDHLAMSASLTFEGTPVSNGPSIGTPVSNGPSVGGGLALHTGNRDPVALLMPQPVRPVPKALPTGRRPVVAVLDTGIGPHPWWDNQNPADPIIEVSQEFQDLLAAAEVGQLSPTQPSPLDSPYEQPDEVEPLLGLIDSHSGHGTFVSGLVHQLCPAAKILSLRVLHSDGFTTESAMLVALNWLLDQVKAGRPVDVVSMSLGFYAETADPLQVLQVLTAIEELTSRGVLVVAAAGNDATTRPFMPAAFARGTGSASGGVDLLAATGARNAAGRTTAAFSNWGEWITKWAPGNALVSTVPVWEGAGGASIVYPDGAGVGPFLRTAPDPDDLRSGFAVWAGTSFATPVVSGVLADALAKDANCGSDRLDRAKRALEAADVELSRRHWQ